MTNPEVTIFMAVYNGSQYIKQAIESALLQTFQNFELLIIDDGSTDESLNIIESFHDDRIRLLRNENNVGLFRTRNRGVKEAKGQYFATLDCDDIAPPKRLERQLQYFSKHPECAVCAGRIIQINANGTETGKSTSLIDENDFLKALLLFVNLFYNSTTMIRMDIMREFQYRHGYEPAEDFDLFERISSMHTIGVINEVLSYYRVHDNNISLLKKETRKNAEKKIITRQLDKYLFNYTEDELDLHLHFTNGEFEAPLEKYATWLAKLKQQNAKHGFFARKSFDLAIAIQWMRICKLNLGGKTHLSSLFSYNIINLKHVSRIIYLYLLAK